MAAQPSMPIAIVGIGCRFAGDVTSPEKLWELCAAHCGAWSEIPKERFNQEGFYHPDSERPSTMHVGGGYFLKEDIGLFDASFFNFSTEVAESMDPQIRLQLECTFEALENAGLTIQDIAGTQTSVFGGSFFRDYHDSLMRDPETLPRPMITGNGSTMISNRISHFFDLRGPSMTIDTGCSTSLTSVHMACQSLRTGDASMSIVAAANLMINPDNFMTMTSLGVLGPQGKCFAWDDRAEGYGRGEGVATVILRPLQDAIEHGDHVYAVIRETASNQDGKTPTITAPSLEAQTKLIRDCYRKADLSPKDTTFAEAHMTGTLTGDPIEAEAIGSVFSEGRDPDHPVYVGSVKTNIGHTEGASGLASLIRIALALEKEIIPPNMNFETPNRRIPFEKYNLVVPTTLMPWPADRVLRASINNFGYGGTNAHAILESFKYHRPSQSNDVIASDGSPASHSTFNGFSSNGLNGHASDSVASVTGEHSKVIVLSAKDKNVLLSQVSALASYLAEDDLPPEAREDRSLADVAFTLSEHRSRLPWATATRADSIDALVDSLRSGRLTPTHATKKPRLGFVFNGQGAQWHAMGRELIEAYPVFRAALYEAEECFKRLGAAWSLVEELKKSAEDSRVHEASMSQPLCVAIQVCLVRVLESWGVRASAVTSHSSGEIAAAYAAGVLSFADALAVVFFRGQLTEKIVLGSETRGGMLAVGLSSEDAQQHLLDLSCGKLIVACINSPSSVTISGDILAIDELESKLGALNVFARKLKVPTAYHSHHMHPMATEYEEALERSINQLGSLNELSFYSPVTGSKVSSAKLLGPKHWVSNLVQPVRFSDAMAGMSDEIDFIVELGPHGALKGPIQQTLGSKSLPYGACLTRGDNAVSTMQDLASLLLQHGYPVNLANVNFPTKNTKPLFLHQLPTYSWNHSTRYWREPRVSKEHRLTEFPVHDLLGSRLKSSNALTPTWRHFLRVNEIPWLQDHSVHSDFVFPGAGYIAMAIEAVRQQCQLDQRTVSGYKLRDVDILSALVVPDTAQGVEVQLTLCKCSSRELDDQGWQEFFINSHSSADDAWTENCRGLVKPNPSKAKDETPPWVESSAAEWYQCPGEAMAHVEPDSVFSGLRSMGLYHGPSFQNLVDVQSGAGKSKLTFRIHDIASLMPRQFQQSHVLHPTTLDSIFQAAFPVLDERDFEHSIVLPRSIKSLFVSSEICSQAGHLLVAAAKLDGKTSKDFRTSIAVCDADNVGSEPVLEMKGFLCQSIGEGLRAQQAAETKTCFSSRWIPDLAFMNPNSLEATLTLQVGEEEREIGRRLAQACFYFIDDALDELTEEDVEKMEWHHKVMYDWMKHQHEQFLQHPDISAWRKMSGGLRELFLDDVASESVNGELLHRVGNHLLDILRKEIAPLELMLQNRLLYDFYEKALRCHRTYEQVSSLVSRYGDHNPRCKVLEIGGGTGGCTGAVLNALGGGETGRSPHFKHYDFTDVSAGFFESAKQRFHSWRDKMSFKKLDIEINPEEQQFEAGSYDLIVACQVLHATKSMRKTMAHVRSLLKPGGKLIMVETTRDIPDVQLIFGTLPGWWLSEEPDRKYSPNMSKEMWQDILLDADFSGLEVEAPDCSDAGHYSFSVIMSTANGPREYKTSTKIVYVDQEPPESWLSAMKSSLAVLTGAEPAVQKLDHVEADDSVCIFVGELERPLLYDLSAEEFASVQKMLLAAAGILWATAGGVIHGTRPEFALHAGLLRTLRAEDMSKRVTALDLGTSEPVWSKKNVAHLIAVFERNFNYAYDKDDTDAEYAVENSEIHVQRVHEDAEENAVTSSSTKSMALRSEPFDQPDHKIRLDVGTRGLLDSLCFQKDPIEGPMQADEIELDVKCFGLNFRDVMIAMGQLDDEIMGYECSGVVLRVGDNAGQGGLKVGDRACALLRGHYANRVYAKWSCVGRIPDNMSFETAASVPLIYITSYHSLIETAHLKPGETVLIHSGTGGVGQSAILVAQHVGAEIFTTVSTDEKKQFLIDNYGIKPSNIFNSRNASFAKSVMAATNNKGVDVILNSLAGPLLLETWKCIARFGRFVEIGRRDIETAKHLDMTMFRRAATFSAVELLQLWLHRNSSLWDIMNKVLKLMDQGRLRPITPINVFPVSETQQAFRLMQSGRHRGKIVIRPSPGDMVKVMPARDDVKFHPDASYVVSGGLGGIGKSVARWMVRRGAKHLILFSRAAATTVDAQAFKQELESMGCKVVAENCDTADSADLERAMNGSGKEFPPVRGVIQAAMVLQDSIIENMTFTQWQAAIRPKVRSTQSLSARFDNVDFFVILSSLTGVLGNPSQANYSAGGTFQDAFAKHLTGKGIPAVCIDLGSIKSVGYVARNEGVEERLKKMGYEPIEEEKLLRIIESAIRNPYRPGEACVIITGLALPDEDRKAFWDVERRFGPLTKLSASDGESGDGRDRTKAADDFKMLLPKTGSAEEAVGVVLKGIVGKISEMFNIPEAEIDSAQPVETYGIDSLVAVEMRNWLSSRAKADISIFDVLQSKSVRAVAEKVALKSQYVLVV